MECDGEHTIEIVGGNTGYEEGGILEIRVDGEVIFRYGQDMKKLWKEYWKKHPEKLEEYDDV